MHPSEVHGTGPDLMHSVCQEKRKILRMSQPVFAVYVTTILWRRLAKGQSGEDHSLGECLSYLWWQHYGTKGVVITITESMIDHRFGEADSPDTKIRRK